MRYSHPHRHSRSGLLLTILAAASLVVSALPLASTPPAQAAQAETNEVADEQYRPTLHFTPEANWMNDPNGLVYYKGSYHLFFQHNPNGTRWSNMSWGHATSPDLLHWTEQPLAIAQEFDDDGVAIEDIFSGSIVVDEANSSGLGTTENPPLVAIYTSAYTPAHPTHAGKQAQSLAYSLDDGRSWSKYEGNPVLDRDSANFRDPKVFRYDGPAGSYWVMVAVEATDYKAVLYKSDDLKNWEHLSDFGPANSIGGIWECPDLFPLAVDGDPENIKWVMVVNLNPGAVAGGSGGQYFVGEFDGTTFTSESTVTTDSLPNGDTFADFENGYADWTAHNEPGNRFNGPWSDAPASGSLTGQNPVTGFVGEGLINGFHDGDWAQGTIDSPSFTVQSDYVNFLVGGGNHPHVPGTQLGNEAPNGQLLFDGFELPDGESLVDAGWQLTGDFEAGRNPSSSGGDFAIGTKRINTWEGGPNGDDNRGSLTSPEFTIDAAQLSFLLGGGGRSDGSLQLELLVDDAVVRSQTGPESGELGWHSWEVADLVGETARVRVVDEATGGWGHLTVDHFVLGPDAALARSNETSVNLVVDGKIVRSASGANSEVLDWASWNVSEYSGRQASIRIIDNNRGGWGHVLADQFMFADEAAPTRLERYDWLDWGKDYYATVSFSNAPDNKRVMLGWMSNWDYANDTPTTSWRSAMALPREVALTTTPKGPRLTQQVTQSIDAQRIPAQAYSEQNQSVTVGSRALPITGDVVQIDAVLRAGSATSFGIGVLEKGSSSTRIGYDTASERLFVDRTKSGNTTFNPSFSSVDDAPVSLSSDGSVNIRAYVDRASVEVFAADGTVTLTDLVFPETGASGISLWSEGGTAEVQSLTVTPLAPSMFQPTIEPPIDDGAATAPGVGTLSHNNGWSNGLYGGSYTVSMNLWWGENASSIRLYENTTLVSTQQLKPASPLAQRATLDVSGKANGSYEYTAVLVNSKGETATKPMTVVVRDANPSKPVLSSDNRDKNGAFTLTANLWWGTNANSYSFYDGDVLLATGTLVPSTPGAQQATLNLTNQTKGNHSYRVEFTNDAGSTSSTTLTMKITK